MAADDPTSDAALLALEPSYAAAPDMPVAVIRAELAVLAGLARSHAEALSRIGVPPRTAGVLETFAERLGTLEAAWRTARNGPPLSDAELTLLLEAEALDAKLLAGGRWACRDDDDAQQELSRIADGSGLLDTVLDLRDHVGFWATHAIALARTDITRADLDRASALADALEPAALNEDDDAEAGRALELRNRCFWAADDAAKLVRDGGRYAFRLEPELASKFHSRFLTSAGPRPERRSG